MGTLRDDVLGALAGEERDGDAVRARFCFAPELPVFAGHFPGAPLVPGVYLIEAARLLGERAVGARLRIAAITEAKFTAPALPGEEVCVEERLTAGVGAARACRATFTAAGRAAAKIRLELAPDTEAKEPATCNA
jgi:3-hydroxyacyl-[acyl-carrier-protein] dehydratase